MRSHFCHFELAYIPNKLYLIPCTKFHNKYYATKALRELHDSSSIHSSNKNSRRQLALLLIHLVTRKNNEKKNSGRGDLGSGWQKSINK